MPPINRREFLRGGLALGLGVGVSRYSLAAIPGDSRFVLVILRGGMDGLAAVPPIGDRNYRTVRGDLAIPEPGQEGGALALDDRFGLHPSFAPIYDLWAKDQLQVVHATCTPYRDRSHFDAQNVLETGGDKPSSSGGGWLNRALSLLGGEGIAIGQSAPLVFAGPTAVLTWAPSKQQATTDGFLDTLQQMYDKDELFHNTLAAARETQDLVMMDTGRGTSDAPPVGRANPFFEGLARMMRQPSGPRIGTVELTGWDTHAGQGSSTGRLAGAFRVLAEGLAAFRAGMGPEWGRTVVIAATEFGRTARPNGTLGTDHGTGGASLILGGGLDGRRVFARWPGLSEDKLIGRRDLAVTTDLRSAFAAVLENHLGLSRADIAGRIFTGARELRPLEGMIRA
jgi:uncharacterized protein (DUF1501 family)